MLFSAFRYDVAFWPPEIVARVESLVYYKGLQIVLDSIDGVMSWERGPTYHMNDAILFKEVIAVRTDSAEGQAYRHNQRLLEVADKIARDKMAVEWYRDPNANMADFHHHYENRATSKTHLAAVAEKQGLVPYLRRWGGGSPIFNDHEKAEAIEALVAAVEIDSDGTGTNKVLRAFGMFYSYYLWEHGEIEKTMEAGKQAYMAYMARKAVERL